MEDEKNNCDQSGKIILLTWCHLKKLSPRLKQMFKNQKIVLEEDCLIYKKGE